MGSSRRNRHRPCDVFLCLGILIIYWSLGAFLRIAGIEPMLLYAGFAVLFWLLAEFFVFGSRRKLPAVLSIVLFVWLAYRAIMLFLGDGQVATFAQSVFQPETLLTHLAVLCGGFALALLRFRQPITVLGLGLCGVMLVYGLARLYLTETPSRLVLMTCGLVMLFIGVVLDWQDKARTGIKHEWALWMFVLGSPLTVHPLFLGIIGDRLEGFDLNTYMAGVLGVENVQAVANEGLEGVVWLVAGLAIMFVLLGLLFDRRSLVASCLLYLSAVLTYLILEGGLGFGWALAVVPLTIGLLVILLGVAWVPIRRALLAIMPFRSLFRPAV